MKLLRKQIAGNVFVNEQASGVFPYQYNATTLAGWDDATSIENLHLYGHHAADYMRATKEMADIFEAKAGATEADKWANCSSDEKACLAKRHIIVDKDLRLEVLSTEDDFNCFAYHAKMSIECRQKRIQYAQIAIGYAISEAVDRVDLYNEVLPRIGSFVGSNDPDLKDWVKSVGAYVGGGMKAKTYWNQGIEDIFVNIVENGIY